MTWLEDAQRITREAQDDRDAYRQAVALGRFDATFNPAVVTTMLNAVDALNEMVKWADRHYATQYGDAPIRARLALAAVRDALPATEEATP